jgi:PhnB protein
MAKAKPIPDGYHSVTPYLTLNDATGAIEFYKKAFGAKEKMRLMGPGGKIGHAEIVIGDSPVMLADESPMMGTRSPKSMGGSPISIVVYVENVDGTVKQAVSSGAKLERPIEDKFYGDRMGSVIDPYGYMWHIATHIEDVTPEEIDKRMKAMFCEELQNAQGSLRLAAFLDCWNTFKVCGFSSKKFARSANISTVDGLR